ncbi:hypothetical protein BUALT_Bualt01G0005600 [Buddleja alternifolia]|uniref:Transmembrane protein 18 n=1 Tax=Buddleja alternifolia TaxID=168488 RepID=A0AAV6Y3F3_9LAMI|nr:hypothetical protein BUALT_Bualt01G0005600 [Buddleja alternifolia]
MEELQSALNSHMDQMADLVEKLTVELRSGIKPAVENFIGFFHAIDWKVFTSIYLYIYVCVCVCVRVCISFYIFTYTFEEPWLISLIAFHVLFLLVAFMSRKNINFQMCLFLLALGGVYLAERLNRFLAGNWKSFAGQNYFDPQGLFLSVLWSGPLLVIAILILVNTLFSLCHLIVRWKKAELRHRARVARSKDD